MCEDLSQESVLDFEKTLQVSPVTEQGNRSQVMTASEAHRLKLID
jgi:hypothetical protein